MEQAIEPLERRLLHVRLYIDPPSFPPTSMSLSSDGTLIVIGGGVDDHLRLTRNFGSVPDPKFISVAYGSRFGAAYGFPAAGVRGVRLEGSGGSDYLEIDPSFNLPVTLMGGEGYDTLIGAQNDDWLVGEAAGDEIRAGGGNDVIHAGADIDVVYGGDGNDTLLGLNGSDVLFGGWGQDWLDGGQGDDYLRGEDSNDFLEGGPGDDHLDGGAGTDTLYGGDGNDYLIGGRGVGDSMRGGTGNDRFRADDVLGNGDSMWGEAGFDVLVAAADDDDFFARGPQTR